MHVKIKNLIVAMFMIIIVFIVLNIYPLTLKDNKKFENPNDFNSIRKNFIPNENILIQKENFNSWSLSIPKINLRNIAIHESVDSETLESYIGHFEFSSYLNGNVSLAAHSYGYTNNYFKDIHLLEIGDEIIYKYNDIEKVYAVVEKEEILESDLSILQERGIDEITLVTCVPDSPNLRLYIKALSEE